MNQRPILTFLNPSIIQQIIEQARDLLFQVGIEIYHPDVVSLLADHGATVELQSRKVKIPGHLIDKTLKTTPHSFQLYDTLGNQTHDFSLDHVYFTPASSALKILDPETNQHREPNTHDFIHYVKINHQLKHIASQSTAFIPADVSEKISDSYRLYLCLLYSNKPIVTGTFSPNGFPIMKNLQLAVRGSENALKEKPLTIFSCCSTTPLKWSGPICNDIIDCGASHIPIELISMPLTGFTAPVTLIGSLTGHTAELLSGIAISQLAHPGTPLLYGGAPSAFDIRFQTTPLGAIETMMMDCAYNEIGKFLGLPTQAYIGLSDAKLLDAQAGLETSMGAVMGALSGINNIAGPGMLDFVNCFCIEKLILDNETCGMTYRLLNGIETKEDFPIVPAYRELLKEGHLLVAKHSRRYLKEEHYFPGPVIDRTGFERWQERGSLTLMQRAAKERQRLLEIYPHSLLPPDIEHELTGIMEQAARRCGMDRLPSREE